MKVRVALASCLLTLEALSQAVAITVTATEDSIIVNDTVAFSNQDIAKMDLANGIDAALIEDYQGAIGYFDAALLFDTENPDIWYNRGLAYYYLDDFAQAVPDFSKALALRPTDTTALSQRGITYAQLGDTGRALTDLNELLRINPRSGIGHYNKGIVYLQMEHLDQACDLLRKAAELGYEGSSRVISTYCH